MDNARTVGGWTVLVLSALWRVDSAGSVVGGWIFVVVQLVLAAVVLSGVAGRTEAGVGTDLFWFLFLHRGFSFW